MRRTRVVVLNLRRMLNEIVTEMLAAQPDIDVASRHHVGGELGAIADREGAHVVILEQNGRRVTEAYEALLTRRPQLKILAITGDGRETFLYELRPCELPLGQLSEASLLEAVRGPRVLP